VYLSAVGFLNSEFTCGLTCEGMTRGWGCRGSVGSVGCTGPDADAGGGAGEAVAPRPPEDDATKLGGGGRPAPGGSRPGIPIEPGGPGKPGCPGRPAKPGGGGNGGRGPPPGPMLGGGKGGTPPGAKGGRPGGIMPGGNPPGGNGGGGMLRENISDRISIKASEKLTRACPFQEEGKEGHHPSEACHMVASSSREVQTSQAGLHMTLVRHCRQLRTLPGTLELRRSGP
jgi:hypothetical protein